MIVLMWIGLRDCQTRRQADCHQQASGQDIHAHKVLVRAHAVRPYFEFVVHVRRSWFTLVARHSMFNSAGFSVHA